MKISRGHVCVCTRSDRCASRAPARRVSISRARERPKGWITAAARAACGRHNTTQLLPQLSVRGVYVCILLGVGQRGIMVKMGDKKKKKTSKRNERSLNARAEYWPPQRPKCQSSFLSPRLILNASWAYGGSCGREGCSKRQRWYFRGYDAETRIHAR